MNSVEFIVIVEGVTEQTFVRDVLAPALERNGLYLTATMIGKPGHKGGNIRFDRVKNDIRLHLAQRPHTYITTMFDYFGINQNWPGYEEILHRQRGGASLTVLEKAHIIEQYTHQLIAKEYEQYEAQSRFIPYIQFHEIEALLFSKAEILATETGVKLEEIQSILREYNNDPEAINNDPKTAPSKRLIALAPAYRKVSICASVTKAIGISVIRERCTHFNDWLTRLENTKR